MSHSSATPGTVIICLDNDPAGKASMERLCATGILARVENLNGVVFLIGSHPAGVKDAAEFMERYKDDAGVRRKFRYDVLDKAVPWEEWYTSNFKIIK